MCRKQRGKHQKGGQGGEEWCSCWKGSGCPWRARGKSGQQARMKQPGNCRRGGENGAGPGHLFIPVHTPGYERSDSGRTESNVPVSLSQCPPPPPPVWAQQEESGLDIIWSWISGWVCLSLCGLCSDGRAHYLASPTPGDAFWGLSSSNMPCLATSGLSCPNDSCLSWMHSCHVPEIFSWPSLVSCVRSAPRESGKIPPLT